MRRGVRLGVDVGTVRVGVARCDPDGMLATPVETVPRDLGSGTDLARIAALVTEWQVLEVVVGLPLSLSGRPGSAAEAASDTNSRGKASSVAVSVLRMFPSQG